MSQNTGPKVSMFRRRSSSLSHIPLRRDSRNSRAKSSSRNDNIGKLRRSNSSSSIQRTTPLRTGLNVPKLSSGRTSSARKLSTTSSVGRSPFQTSSVKKERPVNDKKWIMEQFMKVRRYLADHPGCDPNVLNNMKPPSINTFVYICNILLKDVDPRINVTMADYKESVLSHLKLLRYPGNISNSILKTVNTMHAWPQVINVFSWLVDLLCFIQRNTYDLDDSGPNPKEALLDLLTERYNHFNKFGPDASPDEINERFLDRMNKALNIDEEKLEELRQEKERLSSIKEKTSAELAKWTETNENLRNDIEMKKSMMEKFYTEDPLNKEKSEKELKMLSQKKSTILQEIKETKKNINDLRKTISNQPCTYKEKKHILAQISEMKYTIELKKEKLQKCMEIKDKYDYKLTELKRKLETEIYRLNTFLMQIVVLHPEMKVLQLRDKGFHQETFKDEIDKCMESKQVMEHKLSENITKVRTEIESSEVTKTELCNTVGVLEQATQGLINAKQDLESKIKNVEEDIRSVLLKSEELKKEYAAATEELRNKEPDLEDLQSEIQDLTSKKTNMENDFLKYQKDALRFFEQSHQLYNAACKSIDDICISIKGKLNKKESVLMEKYTDLLDKLQLLQQDSRNLIDSQ